ncbi:pentatricopeptide repeat-containing protein At2g30780-like [Lotus japonicus]|uniref:pentatricopeptide repeat-containing protein At2g30780-like n=1 Tax=Lotus japonicus TaxID=34305 RepID=UPI00258C9081|nr:pentatricopeptide repeat-containing protein At2g30780-like [Lotus japonicus]XP_057443172.1 pentatricopeptide repeat-containing protein At2g30780-like [Lotus japonicus]XP_057443173.1 pentatricopeptide repeat-containing protein At2g30780-like [Lotus japonicus]
MAFAIRVLRTVGKRFEFFPVPQHSFFFCKHANLNANPLLLKLVQVSNSRIKTTLDQEMPSFQSSQLSWDSLVTSLIPCSSDKARLVLEWILEKMLKENVKDHSLFSELILLCGKLKNLPLGMRVFTSMETIGVKPSSLVFNSLISACLSSNDIVTAYSLFEIMESSESYKPDFHTYNIFISFFSKSGNVDDMLAWYSAEKAAGLGSYLQMFESLISGCVNSRNFEIADQIFEEMMVSEIIPSVSILESMLKGHCKQKSLGRAEEFFRFVLDTRWEVSEIMAEMLVALYLEQGRVEKMEELLETMTKPCLVKTGVLSQIHCGIVRMYAMLDRLDDVEFAVGRMLKQGLSFTCADDVEKVICSYFRREAYDRLDMFLECLECCYVLTRSTYDLLISGYKRASLHEKVDSVLEDMKSAGLV